jgi:ADP-ribose diphosphatase
MTFGKDEYFALESDSRGERFIRSHDEVLVLPLTHSGQVLLAIEPSPAFGEDVLILPGGTASPHESPTETANRELQEEVGYRAGRLDLLGELRPWPKYLRVRSLVYLARDLEPSRLPGDEPYVIGVARTTLADFETLITTGRLRDARAIAALHLARAFLRAKERA